jgi:hypothetical protein
MWSARKIPMMMSADMPWATRSAAGTGWTFAGAGAFLSARNNATMASIQHATQNHMSGTGSPSIVSTTPMKVNNVGAATASSALAPQLGYRWVADLGEVHRRKERDRWNREGEEQRNRCREPGQRADATLGDRGHTRVEARQNKGVAQRCERRR